MFFIILDPESIEQHFNECNRFKFKYWTLIKLYKIEAIISSSLILLIDKFSNYFNHFLKNIIIVCEIIS